MLSYRGKSREETCKKIVELYSVDEVPIPQLAKRFNVSNQAIRDVLRKENALKSPAGRYSINLRDARRERKTTKCGANVSTN
jgi:predicted DNA-binding protein YlxM (UPF0122 family)